MTTLADNLRAIGLTHTAAELDDLIALATKRRWSATQLLEHITDAEQRERAKRSLDRRVDRSRLGGFKSLADFDWAWPTRIDREAVDGAMALDFLAGHRNIVLVAPQGLGKTMIAQNILHAALQAGHNALFITAAQMWLDLGGQESARTLDRRASLLRLAPTLVHRRNWLSVLRRTQC